VEIKFHFPSNAAPLSLSLKFLLRSPADFLSLSGRFPLFLRQLKKQFLSLSLSLSLSLAGSVATKKKGRNFCFSSHSGGMKWHDLCYFLYILFWIPFLFSFLFACVDTVFSMVTCQMMIRLVLYDLQNNKHYVGGCRRSPSDA